MGRVRFGEVAVELGYLTPDQLRRALTIQQQEAVTERSHRHIGRICIDEGYLSLPHVLTVLERQGLMTGGCV
jgi:hypothetical protein